MNKFQFILLSVLEENGATSALKAMSSYDIQNEIDGLNYSTNYICRTLNAFQQHGLVRRGLNDRRAVTFFITKEGIDKINGLRGGIENER